MESQGYVNYTVLSGLILGASVILLMYILKLFRSDFKTVSENKHEQPKQQQPQEQPEKRKEPNQKHSRKKATDSRWTGRSEKSQTFNHPWLLTNLKGHSGQIQDMDFSANGKYLASCADEDADSGGGDEQEDSGGAGDSSASTGGSTASSSSKEETRPSSASSSSSSSSPRTKGLSRRQRKNRRRDKSPRRPSSPERHHVPLKHFERLQVDDETLYRLLRSYVLSRAQMLTMGYPLDSQAYRGKSIVFKTGPPPYVHKETSSSSRFDVNAREFFPRNYVDSGHESGQSSASSSDSEETALVKTSPKLFTPKGVMNLKCVRCSADFSINETDYITQDRCFYHYGKLKHIYAIVDGKTVTQTVYECCSAAKGEPGCTTARLHVWSGLQVGLNGPFDYVRTKPRRCPPSDGNFGVYALDCEMVYTVQGMECARVTVVAADGRLVYDVHVRPEAEVVDYNTRFSGITAKDLRSASKTLKDVQNDLMGFISADTLLVGHSLENDLRALRMVHHAVVDTAVAFPHYNGLPFRRSLKSLVSMFLKREIQCGGAGGHDSVEDSRACMDLMLWRVRKDFIGLLEHCK